MNRFICLALALASLAIPSMPASASASTDFWQDIREIVVRCAQQPYAFNERGRKIYGSLESVCSELKPAGRTAAWITLGGSTLLARLQESPFSDGGDLDDLVLYDPAGNVVARRVCVLSFGDILLALAGGEADFREVYVPRDSL